MWYKYGFHFLFLFQYELCYDEYPYYRKNTAIFSTPDILYEIKIKHTSLASTTIFPLFDFNHDFLEVKPWIEELSS